MTEFSSIIDAQAEVMRLFYRDEFPGRVASVVKDKIDTRAGPVDIMVVTGEAIYAYRDDEDMTPEIKELGAALIMAATIPNNFYGLQQNNRGEYIAHVLRGQELPAGADTPEPNTALLPDEPAAVEENPALEGEADASPSE